MTNAEYRAWLSEHLGRHRRSDWPEGEGAVVLFNDWLAAFRARGVTPDEAAEASRWLLEQGGAWPDAHLGRLLGRVDARRRDRLAETSPARRAAEREAVAAEKAREAELRARWRSLPRAERRAIVAAVKAENPGLCRWPLWVLRVAIDRAAACMPAGAAGEGGGR